MADPQVAHKRCSVCHATYAGGERFCSRDGGAIVDVVEDGDADDLIGKTIDGRYLVRRFIGKGGMGMVYEAEHVGLDKRVAIKFVSDRDADRDARARFRQEARAASKITDENVVQIFDVGTSEDGRDFLVMEYVQGNDLQHLIDTGPLDVARAVTITREILAGLGAIHAAGIVHRDIKPANILLAGSPERVKIMDFGIAKLLHTPAALTTGTGRVIGTPQFIAPELLLGAEPDARADR
jgi:serine/threonine protein kinase